MDKLVYKFSKWLRVIERINEDGKILAVIDTNPAVIIVPFKRSSYIFVRQFRPVVGKYVIEFPAGRVEEGEDYVTAARRELKEETGYEAKVCEPLIKSNIYASPGFTTEFFIPFWATGLIAGEQSLDDEEKGLEIIELPKKGLWPRLVNGIGKDEIIDCKTLACLAISENL